MHSATASWPERLLGELLDIARQTVTPSAFPNEQFVHFSIPAWDEKQAPALELGSNIGSAKISITQPTLLVSKLNPRIPRVAYVRNPMGLRHCASTEFIPYVAKDDSISLEFFRWFLQSSLFQRRLERIATGSTNSHTRARPGETLGWSVPYPPPEDQRRIAAVLDTVDEAIAKTEAVIAKLKQVRAGLLHNLLTRGLDEHGQLRDPIAHPEQFQDSLFGHIPKEWEIRTLNEIVSSAVDGPFGSNLKTEHYVNEPGVRVVRLQNIESGQFNESDKAFVSEDYALSLQRHQVVSGDLLVASMGDENHLLARACLYPAHLPPGIVKADCFRLRMKTTMAMNGFVMLFLNCPSTRRELNILGQGVTRDRVNLTTLLTLWVLRPPVEEQRRIVKVSDALDLRIQTEETLCSKLTFLKSGLMTDLLTGRVRVPEHFGVRRHAAAWSLHEESGDASPHSKGGTS